MSRPRQPLAEQPSAANVLLRKSLGEDGAPPSTANLSAQAPEYGRPLYGSSPTIHKCKLPDPYSSELVSPAAVQPPTPLSPTPLSPRSPPLSPFSSISEQDEPPYLSDSNEDLWEEVMAFRAPSTEPYAQTQSLMKSTDQLSMILATNTPMFNWRINEGRIEELDYKLHWLNSLKPKGILEKFRICKLAVSGLQQLCVPPLRSGIGTDFKRLANLADVHWRHSIFQNLFPLGSETPSLFALLGDNDLHLLQLPSKSPAADPPDLVYSMTAEIFPTQYREDLKLLLFNKKDYAVPYLTIFLTNRRYGESSKRMELWGVHMLDARVTEWCRACYPARKLTKKPPPKLPSTAPTAKMSVSQGWELSTRRPTKSATEIPALSNFSTSAKVQPEVDKRLEGAPCHYSIALEHAQYSIWRFEADLRMTSNSIERRGVKCTQFKENSTLLTDMQWEDLASDLVGIHLDAANQTGGLVKGAVTLMRSPKSLVEGLSESVAGEGWGNGGWSDEDRWGEAPRENWTSAFNED